MILTFAYGSTSKERPSCSRHAETRGRARVVFASSLAVFGGESCPPVVGDETKPLPQTTYGMTKLAGELMINDYSRKDFLDGRAVRLPTIFIRPGKPNAALSSFASGLFREPLSGFDFELPVSREQGGFRSWAIARWWTPSSWPWSAMAKPWETTGF